MSYLDDLTRIVCGDMTDVEAKAMRTGGVRLAWRMVLVIVVFFAMGWGSFLGVPGFASQKEVDAKLRPISEALARNTAILTNMVNENHEQSMRLLRISMVDLQTKKCRAPKDETKEIYRTQISDAQERYLHLTGSYFPIPNCNDL